MRYDPKLHSTTDLLVRAVVEDVLSPGEVLDGDEPVADVDAAVDRGRAALHDLGHVDAVVARNVLVPDATRDCEAEALVIDLNDEWGTILFRLES